MFKGPLKTRLKCGRILIKSRTQCSIRFLKFFASLTQNDTISQLGAILDINSFRICLGHIDDTGILAIFIPPILKDQRNAGHADAHKDDNKDAANVLYGYAIRLILRLLALGLSFIVLPPFFLEFLQLSFVQQSQDAERFKQGLATFHIGY